MESKKLPMLILATLLLFSIAACYGTNFATYKDDFDPTSVSANIGDIIQFGGYEWLVLDKQEDSILIITNKSNQWFGTDGGNGAGVRYD